MRFCLLESKSAVVIIDVTIKKDANIFIDLFGFFNQAIYSHKHWIWRRILTLALTLAPASSIPRQSDGIALKYNLWRATKLRV